MGSYKSCDLEGSGINSWISDVETIIPDFNMMYLDYSNFVKASEGYDVIYYCQDDRQEQEYDRIFCY